MPGVAVRVDASAPMGAGHARRCFSLASALQALGAPVVFVSRALDAASRAVMAGAPAPVRWLPAPASPAPHDPAGPAHQAWAGVGWRQDAEETAAALAGQGVDTVLVDHYAFDARWHEAVASALGCGLAAVDDLADRPLRAGLVLDPNWSPDPRARFAPRLQAPAGGRAPLLLAGSRYALLGPAFRDPPPRAPAGAVRSLGIFMGGTDLGGISARVLAACLALPGFDGAIEVVSTGANPHLPALRAACAASPRVTLALDLPDLAAFFARHDLHVGAGGGATWERCRVGAPTVALVIADNQRPSLSALAGLGAVVLATLPGLPPCDGAVPLAEALGRLLDAPAERQRLAEAGARQVDGRGAERVALALRARDLALRPARTDDAAMLHAWRNDPAIRATSHDGREIALDDHRAWMARVLADPARHLLVAQVGPRPVGSARWDRLAGGDWEVSLYLDPALTGLGLGARLLAGAEDWLAGRCGDGLVARASVRADNPVSARMFAAGGWREDAGGRFSKTLRRPAPPTVTQHP